jgi:hypothetical protein
VEGQNLFIAKIASIIAGKMEKNIATDIIWLPLQKLGQFIIPENMAGMQCDVKKQPF